MNGAATPRLRTAGMAILLGGAIGVVAALYLMLVRGLEHLIWHDGAPRLPIDRVPATIGVCVIGGLLVGLLRHRHDADSPHDLDDALHDLDGAPGDGEPGPDAEGAAGDGDNDQAASNPPPKVRWLVRAAALGIVSLGFGASLGPEAPLLMLATGFGRRIAPVLRTSEGTASYISAAGALSGIFGGPLGSVVLPVEGSRDQGRAASLLPYGVLASVAGLAAMLAVLPEGSGLRYDLPVPEFASGRELLAVMGWSALAAIPAAVAGLVLLGLIGPTRAAAERWVGSTAIRGALGGLVLGACGAIAPLALFSGEHGAQDLIDSAADYSVVALIGLAGLKLLATLACLATGWFGGQIFPAIFSGMAMGLAFVAAFPVAPVAVVAAASAGAACTAVLRKPLASVLILLFFFPPSTLVAIVVGVAVATAGMQALGDRVPRAGAPAH